MNEKLLHTYLNPSLYRELCLDNTATQEQIKKCYRELALLWHPDKNKSVEAQDKFLKIQFAYEILSKVDKKKKYDEILEKYLLNIKEQEKAKKAQEELAKKQAMAREQAKRSANTKPKQEVKQTLDTSKFKKSAEMEFLEILTEELRNLAKEMGKIYDKHST